MAKRMMFVAILLSALLVAGLVLTIGVTAAFWSESGAVGGSNSATVVIEVKDSNVWAKYFSYESADDGVYIVKFKKEKGIDSLFNSPILTIPRSIDGNTVVGVSGGVFSDVVLKEMVEEVRIPNTVTAICASAFAGFVNLKKVVFEEGSHCTVAPFAFAGTRTLEGVYVAGTAISLTLADGTFKCGDITFAQNAFFSSAYSPLVAVP